MNQIKTGKFIQKMRKEAGLTQRELAQKLGVSDKTISKWETGNGLPDAGNMLPLCEALGISVNELLSAERLEGEIMSVVPKRILLILSKSARRQKRSSFFHLL